MRLYLKLWKYLSPYKAKLFVALICLIGASLSQLVLPWIIKDVIDDVFINKDMAMLNIIAISVFVIFIVRGFFVYGQQYFLEYVVQKVLVRLRFNLFSVMFHQRGLSYFEQNQTGALMSHFTNDIGALQDAIINQAIDFIKESFILVFSIASMIYIHWKLSLFLFLTVPLIAFAVNKLGKKIKAAGRQVLGQLSLLTAFLQEALSGVRVIKSFAREDYEAKRFEEENNRNFSALMRATRANALLTPIVELLASLGVVCLIWYGGKEVIDGHLSSGSLVAFLIYGINLSNPLKRISRTYGKLQQSTAAAERVFGALEFEPEIKDAEDAQDMPRIKGQVDFDHISFAYKYDEPVINDFKYVVKPGQMVALVGPSGAGKTTLANLIPRFYDVLSGAILIDGLDVRRVKQRSLREQVGIVPQETLLFSGSILENIRYGRLEATDEEVLAAAKAANVAEFAEKFPDAYATEVGERGATLSGGQRQRVAIARAILKDPRILILDEATSALDTESEKLVQDALEILLKGRTSFVIAHRLSTIFKADVILVMEKGRLLEFGTHVELLAQGGLYANLYHTQFRHDAARSQMGLESHGKL